MGKLKLIKGLGMQFTPNGKSKARYGIYECPFCFTQFRTLDRSVNSGNTKSCGCLQKENSLKAVVKHGDYESRLYNIFMQMKARCSQVNAPQYKDYGGRGISVCPEWINDYPKFKEWALSHGYSKKLTIDRRENDGNYTPDNCQWSPRTHQSENTRLIKSNNTSGFRGVTKATKDGRWQAIIKSNRIRHHLGTFGSAIQAAIAYNNFVIQNKTHHPLNIIPDE